MRVRQQTVVEQVHGCDAVHAALLHDQTLEELRRAALELEVATDRVAERRHRAPLRKVVPERIAVDTETGLREEASIELSLVLRFCKGGHRGGEAAYEHRGSHEQRRQSLRLRQQNASYEPAGQKTISHPKFMESAKLAYHTVMRRRTIDGSGPFW
jgi:hypothetical protein